MPLKFFFLMRANISEISDEVIHLDVGKVSKIKKYNTCCLVMTSSLKGDKYD